MGRSTRIARHPRRLLACLGLMLGAAFPGIATAEETKPPSLSSLVPAGGQAGTTVEVTAKGEFPTWPVEAWTDRGSLVWKPLDEAGHFQVTIPPAGSFGLHHVRFHDSNGATAVKPFLVGSVPEASEAEPNNTLGEAMPADSLPLTINGVLEKAGDVDSFRVHLQAGETLVASLEANRLLGSPVDAVLELIDESGAYLARNLDATGLDPRLGYTALRDGVCAIRVYGFPSDPNSTIGLAGGADYFYRLTLTSGGFVSGSLPAVAVTHAATTLSPVGWNLPESLARVAIAPTGEATTWVGFPGVAGVVEVPVVASHIPVAGANASDDSPLTPPFIASGQFTQLDEEHRYIVNAVKDQKLQVRLESQKVGFEADPLLVIHDAAGSSLLTKPEREASFAWSAPADGLYRFDVRDRRGRFGPGFLYRLAVEPEVPAVTASVSADSFTAKPGEPLSIEVSVNRQYGFAEQVEFALAVAPEGVTAEAVISTSEGDTAKKVTLVLTATATASGPLRIIGRPKANAAAANLSDTPAAQTTPVTFGTDSLSEAWLTVLPPAAQSDVSPPSEPE